MGKAPLAGAQTLEAQISSYLNEKFIDFKIGHLGDGVQVHLEDIPEKLWRGLIGPEFVRFAKERELKVAAAHYGHHQADGICLSIIISDWTPTDLARQGWVLIELDNEEIDYYASGELG